jgi:hypothetical protein
MIQVFHGRWETIGYLNPVGWESGWERKESDELMVRRFLYTLDLFCIQSQGFVVGQPCGASVDSVLLPVAEEAGRTWTLLKIFLLSKRFVSTADQTSLQEKLPSRRV